MSALQAQVQAHKARLQRFEQAAQAYQQRFAPPPRPKPVLTQKERRRREYESLRHPSSFLPLARRILISVALEFDMALEDILSRKRDAVHSIPRFVAIGLLFEMTDMSSPAIGRYLHRDHTSILHARNRARELFADEAFRNRVDQIKAELEGGCPSFDTISVELGV